MCFHPWRVPRLLSFVFNIGILVRPESSCSTLSKTLRPCPQSGIPNFSGSCRNCGNKLRAVLLYGDNFPSIRANISLYRGCHATPASHSALANVLVYFKLINEICGVNDYCATCSDLVHANAVYEIQYAVQDVTWNVFAEISVYAPFSWFLITVTKME